MIVFGDNINELIVLPDNINGKTGKAARVHKLAAPVKVYEVAAALVYFSAAIL